MIALPASSQKRYIINNDTIVGYTLQENRKIAIIFLKGDSAIDVSKYNQALCDSLRKQLINFKNLASTYNTKLELSELHSNAVKVQLTNCTNQNNKLKIQRKLLTCVTAVESLLLLLIIIMK